jgi:prepilin-type N-terminal cleavage/methylation domain-containing protein
MSAHQTVRRARPAFTLVEMLVVLAIIVVLAGLLLAFMPSLASQTAESGGAASLQGWLNISRQKAIRNQNPYGLRIWINDTSTMLATECSYIEQPEDFTSITGTITTSTVNVANDTINFTGVDVTGGLGTNTALWPIQPGDYLEVLGSGLMHQIISIDGVNQRLLLSTGTPLPITSATGWRIVRAPRVVNDERLTMPSDVVIDLSTNGTYGNALPTLTAQGTMGGSIDVLFGPSGSVLGGNMSTTFLALWVRMPDTSPPTATNPNPPAVVFAGAPTVIAVFRQTGFVGAYPPIPGTTPYSGIF